MIYADSLPLGEIVAVATLADCVQTHSERPFMAQYPLEAGGYRLSTWKLTDQELAFGDYSEGRFASLLANTHRLPEPVPCKGALSLWDVPPDVEAQIRVQLDA